LGRSSSSATACRPEETMYLLALILSIVAFAYLVYAMLRPEKF
jgi:K+-transporting ATPase KdpF subunit